MQNNCNKNRSSCNLGSHFALFFCMQVKYNKCLRFEADAWRLGSQSCSVKLMTDFGSGILEWPRLQFWDCAMKLVFWFAQLSNPLLRQSHIVFVAHQGSYCVNMLPL